MQQVVLLLHVPSEPDIPVLFEADASSSTTTRATELSIKSASYFAHTGGGCYTE